MFEILDEVCTPIRGTKYSAYVDLFAREDVLIGAGETKIVKLGVKIDLEKLKDVFYQQISGMTMNFRGVSENDWLDFLKSHYLEVALRSSLAVKGLIISNGIGIIDLDYPDEIGLIVHNPVSKVDTYYQDGTIQLGCANGGTHFKIEKGDKVAQCTLKEHKGWLMGYESDVIREGGFGSTGQK